MIKNNPVKASQKLLIQYFITYFIVLIIPLLLGYVYYSKTLEIVNTDAINENVAILKQASSILDQRFEEANSISNQIIANNRVGIFQNIENPLQYPNTYSIINTRESLTNYSTSNKFIWNYFIFFNRSNMVINNQIAYTYERFYRNYMYFQGLSYEDWYKQTTQRSLVSGLSGEIEAVLNDNPSSNTKHMTVLTYTKPLVSYGRNNGMVMVVINKEELTKLLSSINTEGGGITYIENKGGNIITHFSSENYDIKTVQAAVNQSISQETNTSDIILNGNKMMVNYVKSQNNDYTYVAVQSKRVVFAKANTIKNILYIVLIISLFAGTVIAFFMARKNAKPLQEILNNIPMSENNEDIFGNIKFTISDLIKNNRNLEKTLDEQIPILRTNFLSRLINGEFSSQDEMVNVSKYINLNCYDRVYCIVIFKFDADINNYDTLDLTIVNTFKLLLKEALEKVIPHALHCDLNEQQLALLIDYPVSQQENLKPYIEDLAKQVKEEIPKNVFESILISCGNVVHQLIDIPISFEKAKLAFKINSADIQSNILWYAETGNYTVNYFFPIDLQTKLMNNVKAGDKEGVKYVMHILFTQNFINSNLSTSLQKLFIYELLSYMIKLGNQIGMDEKTYNFMISNINNIDKYSDLKQIKIITDSYYLLCDIINEQSGKQSTNTINQIIEYINSYYLDCNISLTTIADKFNMNESYLSYIFKQQSGVKFSSYIENLRMQKAKELLTETDLSINEISEKTGYLSSNTFCRAFRRVTGISSTTFRRSEF